MGTSIEAFSSSERSPTSAHTSSKLLKAKRKPPAVKKPLPPRHASGAFSSTTARAPCSWADSAAHIAALPPPTTITSYDALIDGSVGQGARPAAARDPSEAAIIARRADRGNGRRRAVRRRRRAPMLHSGSVTLERRGGRREDA